VKTWETSDLYLAAFLVARGFELADTRREGFRVSLVFRDDAHLQAVLRTWQTPDGVVVGHRYANAVKDLKALVHR
jgi:hypothetical protein